MKITVLKTLACIPAFNSEKTIGEIVKECLLHVDEVIVCDDGSTDNTAQRAEENGALIVRHEKNYGYGAALITLFDKAREKNVDCMVTLDSDGQHIPEYIPRLLAPLSYAGNDVVIGSRFMKLLVGGYTAHLNHSITFFHTYIRSEQRRATRDNQRMNAAP